ncbi:MAG: Ig-like domain-containing protein, partial [Pseudomonadota bacterium]|nr:Ig-like domain-containing protein [Pseudomonadota bacterium]
MRTIDFTTGPGAASADSIRVSDADPIALPDHAIFTADFARDGHDLILSAPGQPDLRLVDYFLQDTPPDLVADNGAVLRGDLAARLAGPIMPGQYAQVGDAPATDPIGQVETLEGAAWAERADGTRVRLDVGSKIYENDVLVTEGGKLSVTFADGTIFTLAADSRMVIDALVYDAESEDGNSGAFSLIEGGFVFIAGEVARTGGMDVNTPTATMGIRGTTVLVEITTVNGVSTVEVSLNTDPDGGQGAFELRDLDGNLIAFIDSTDTKWIVSPIEGETREVARTTDDLADDQALLLDAVRAYALAFERVDAGGTFVELASNQTSGTNGPQVDDDDGTLGNDSDIDNDTSPPPPPSGGTGGGTTPNPPATGGGATPINAAPDARNDVKTLLEDGRATGNVLTNDSDPDGDDLSVIINTRPKHGTLTIDADGNYSYRPHADYNGTDSFTYTVSDGNGGTDTATVTFTVTPVNDDPVATPETLTVAEDGSAVVYPSFDTTDVDGDEVFISDFGQGANGTVTEDGEGGLVYTPNADFNGSDSFTYTVSDGNGGTDTETVSVTVTPVNDDPVATPETLTVAEDGSAVVYPSFDTTDVDGDEVFISDFGQGANGTVTEDGEGGLVYTPNADFNGTDSFTYTVSDGNGGTDTETVSVTVTPVNDDPVATPESLTVAEDGSAVIYPSFETTDVDGDEVFISDFGQGANGTVTEDGEGGLVYTPNADFNGTDSFTYTVSDGNGGTDTETVSVTVTPVNDDPVATPETLTVAEDGSAVVYPSFDTTDVDGDEVFISDFGQGA